MISAWGNMGKGIEQLTSVRQSHTSKIWVQVRDVSVPNQNNYQASISNSTIFRQEHKTFFRHSKISSGIAGRYFVHHIACTSDFNMVAISGDSARSLIRSACFSPALSCWSGSGCAACSSLTEPE